MTVAGRRAAIGDDMHRAFGIGRCRSSACANSRSFCWASTLAISSTSAAGRAEVAEIALGGDDRHGRLAAAEYLGDRLRLLGVAVSAAQAVGVDVADVVRARPALRSAMRQHVANRLARLADAAAVGHG